MTQKGEKSRKVRQSIYRKGKLTMEQARAYRDFNRRWQLRWTEKDGKIYHWRFSKDQVKERMEELLSLGHREIPDPMKSPGKRF